MIVTALEMRWKRAKAIPGHCVRIVSIEDPIIAHVESQSRLGGYLVEVEFGGGGKLHWAKCSCPDHEGMREAIHTLEAEGKPLHPGIPMLHGVLVCKHCLAVANKVVAK